MQLFTAFGAAFLLVFFKSWQQQNVTHEKYRWILPTSLTMAVVEVYVISLVAVRGFTPSLIIAIGFGSGLGSTLATWLHAHLRKRRR